MRLVGGLASGGVALSDGAEKLIIEAWFARPLRDVSIIATFSTPRSNMETKRRGPEIRARRPRIW